MTPLNVVIDVDDLEIPKENVDHMGFTLTLGALSSCANWKHVDSTHQSEVEAKLEWNKWNSI